MALKYCHDFSEPFKKKGKLTDLGLLASELAGGNRQMSMRKQSTRDILGLGLTPQQDKMPQRGHKKVDRVPTVPIEDCK